jgi:hypothetical protein
MLQFTLPFSRPTQLPMVSGLGDFVQIGSDGPRQGSLARATGQDYGAAS